MANNPGPPVRIIKRRVVAVVACIMVGYASMAIAKGTVIPYGLPKVISNLFTSAKSEQTDARIVREETEETEAEEINNQIENDEEEEANQAEKQVQMNQIIDEQENTITIPENKNENVVFEQVIIVGE